MTDQINQVAIREYQKRDVPKKLQICKEFLQVTKIGGILNGECQILT